MRALASSEDEQGQGACPLLWRKMIKLLPHRISDVCSFSLEIRKRISERDDCFFYPGPQKPVGEPGMEVLFENQSGDFHPGGEKDNGPGAKTSDSDDQIGFYAEEDGEGLDEGKGKEEKRFDGFQASAFDSFDLQGDEIHSMTLHDFFFNAPAAADIGQKKVRFFFLELMADSQSRVDMACRASAADDDFFLFHCGLCMPALLCEIFSRMPMLSEVQNSEERPKLIKGRGIPVEGPSPMTTLIFSRAWKKIVKVIPAATI